MKVEPKDFVGIPLFIIQFLYESHCTNSWGMIFRTFSVDNYMYFFTRSVLHIHVFLRNNLYFI